MIQYSKKICLLGDFGVGKTSLVRRFVYNRFDDKYISTLGVKVSRKTVAVPEPEGIVELTLLIWDIAGSDEFSRIRTSYLRGSAGALLVCDLSHPDTIDSLAAYSADLQSALPDARLAIAVAANKCDLFDDFDSAAARKAMEKSKAMAAALNAPHFVTSALTGQRVEEMFRELGKLLVREVAQTAT